MECGRRCRGLSENKTPWTFKSTTAVVTYSSKMRLLRYLACSLAYSYEDEVNTVFDIQHTDQGRELCYVARLYGRRSC